VRGAAWGGGPRLVRIAPSYLYQIGPACPAPPASRSRFFAAGRAFVESFVAGAGRYWSFYTAGAGHSLDLIRPRLGIRGVFRLRVGHYWSFLPPAGHLWSLSPPAGHSLDFFGGGPAFVEFFRRGRGWLANRGRTLLGTRSVRCEALFGPSPKAGSCGLVRLIIMVIPILLGDMAAVVVLGGLSRSPARVSSQRSARWLRLAKDRFRTFGQAGNWTGPHSDDQGTAIPGLPAWRHPSRDTLAMMSPAEPEIPRVRRGDTLTAKQDDPAIAALPPPTPLFGPEGHWTIYYQTFDGSGVSGPRGDQAFWYSPICPLAR